MNNNPHFANAWKTSSTCKDTIEKPKLPCEEYPERSHWAAFACGVLKSVPFQACFSLVGQIRWTKRTILLSWRISLLLLRWRISLLLSTLHISFLYASQISLLRWRISFLRCTCLSYAGGFLSYASQISLSLNPAARIYFAEQQHS